MKTLMSVVVVMAALGCGNKSSGDACSDAIAKAVDQMVGARKQMMDAVPADQKAKMEERMKRMDQVTGKLKAAITHRCTEDKWSADVLDCYRNASSMPEMKACRGRLPAEASSKLQADEMQVMMTAMGGEGGGMMPPHGPPAGDDAAKLQADLDELTKQVDAAVAALAAAPNDADRTAAQAKLEQLRNQQLELKLRIEKLKAGSATP